jgi:hypothetical protein
MRTKLIAAATSVIAGSLLCVSAASAATTVEIGLGSSPTSLASGSGSTVSYSSTSVTGYSSVSVSGTGNPPLTLPNILDTTNIDVATSGLNAGGLLDVWITEIGLTAPLGTVGFLSGFDLNSDSSSGISVTEKTFYDPGNGAFATTDLLGNVALSPNGSTSVGTTETGVTGPYSVTAEYIVDLTSGQSADGTIDISTTPIPGTLPLFASGLAGFWAWSRKRKPQAKQLPMATA